MKGTLISTNKINLGGFKTNVKSVPWVIFVKIAAGWSNYE